MLGQIERGESSPTIATLWKIASGFEASFSSFIDEAPSSAGKPLYRTGGLQQMHPEDDKIRVMPVFSYEEELGCEVFIIELLPGCEHISPPHEKGVIEQVIVAAGDMEVWAAGKWHPLSVHEGLRFEADQPHGYRNRSSERAIIHDLIHYPRGRPEKSPS